MPPLKSVETVTLKEAFDTGQGLGYVLDFSDRTFREYFAEHFNFDLDHSKYRVNGTSKGKRLQAFLTLEDGKTATLVLHSLWDRRSAILSMRGEDEKLELKARYFAIVQRLEGKVASQSVASPGFSGGSAQHPPPAAKAVLKESFKALLPLSPQARGFAFEKFLGQLFEAYGLAPRSSFRLIGEQIDGSMTLANDFYLIEAKWQNDQTGVGDLLTFSGKVGGKSTWCRGIFFSYAGFSKEGLDAYGHGRPTNIICVDGFDLHQIIDCSLDLREVISMKLRRAAETNRAYVGVAEIFP